MRGWLAVLERSRSPTVAHLDLCPKKNRDHVSSALGLGPQLGGEGEEGTRG